MKRKGLWIILILLLAAGGSAAYVFYTNNAAVATAAAEEPELQTATVRQGDITISATGAGTVIPAEEIDLSFATAGVLTEVLVQVGDEVQVGDVLARIDDTTAQEALTNAELQQLQAAMQTDASATKAGVSYDDISVSQAQINLDIIQAELDNLLNWEPDEDEIAQAEANLAAAQAGFNAALGQESSASYGVEVSRINLEAAQRDLANAQESYDIAWTVDRDWETFYDEPICDSGEVEPCSGQTWQQRIENERNSTSSGLIRAQENLAIAQANYNSTASSTNSSSSTNAQSSILSAELALAAALTGPSEEDIEAATTAVRQAELALQQAELNRESNAISLTQAEMNVAAAANALAATELLSPIAGTVMVVNGAVGETASGGLLTLADLEQPLLEIYLDESDLDKVGIDFEVEVVFDALPDDTFIGHIISVDPQLSAVSGVSVIRAVVQLDAESFAKPQTLPVGLNASVEVIGGRADGALLVPVESLRELSPGSFAVFVMEDGEPQLRLVEVGLMDFTFAEIKAGVAAGDVVTTGIIETE